MAKIIDIEELRAKYFATKTALLAGTIDDPARVKKEMAVLARRISRLEKKELEDLIEM
jgi:hypothetical protein